VVTPEDATVDLLRADLRGGVTQRTGVRTQRVFDDLGAIACWLVVWLISVSVSVGVAHWALLSPLTAEERFYMFGVFFQGVLLLVPMGLACSTFFLWVKRDVRLFIACAVPVGLATGLSPVFSLRSPVPPRNTRYRRGEVARSLREAIGWRSVPATCCRARSTLQIDPLPPEQSCLHGPRPRSEQN